MSRRVEEGRQGRSRADIAGVLSNENGRPRVQPNTGAWFPCLIYRFAPGIMRRGSSWKVERRLFDCRRFGCVESEGRHIVGPTLLALPCFVSLTAAKGGS